MRLGPKRHWLGLKVSMILMLALVADGCCCWLLLAAAPLGIDPLDKF
jgi:hypothetical protein